MSSVPIVRRYHTTDQTAPWEGIAFTYDVGTDELNEALKVSFSQYRTLGERKCAAVIEFFEQELHEMQLRYAATTPARTQRGQEPASSEAQIGTSDDRLSREFNIPPPSPASPLNSAAYRDADRRHSAVQATSSLSLPADPTLATSSTHLVFNAFDGRPMHQKTKRKMTTEEKLEYKRTRQRGACPRCKRTKAKCMHMDSNNSSLNDATGLTEKFQRHITLDADTSDAKPRKAMRVEHSFDTYHSNQGTVQQHAVPSQYQSRRASSASEQSPTVANESQQPDEIVNHCGTLGYVRQLPSFEHHQGSFSNSQLSPYWTNHDQPDTGQLDSIGSFQPGFNDQSGPTYPRSPSTHVQGPDIEPGDFLSVAFPSFSQWGQIQPQDTGMT